MEFELNEEQRMLQEGAERYVAERCGFETRRQQLQHTDAGTLSHWAAFAEMGWLAMTAPPECGGLGLTDVEVALVCEQLGRALVLDPLVPTAVLCSRILLGAEAFAKRNELLTAMVAGECHMALALKEAGGGRNSVVRQTAGGATLSVFKQMVLGGTVADHFVVVAREQDESGALTLWLLPREVARRGIKGYALLDGSRACDLQLENINLPADHCIARGEQASVLLELALDHARVAQLAEAMGGQRACMDLTVEHVKTREQFGQPIGGFQAVQHMLAEVFVDYQTTRSMVYRALAHLNEPSAARAAAVSAAKLVVTRAGRAISKTAVQLHGACGFTDEYAVSHHYRRQVVLGGLFGDEVFHAARLVSLAVRGSSPSCQ